METFFSIVLGILSSLVASIVWLFVFSRLRPKIDISDKIAKATSSNGRTVYKIKIINRGHRPIINIKVKLSVATPKIVPGGYVITTHEVQLKQNEVMGIPEFDKKDTEALYAFRFLTYENLDELWADDKISFVSFRIYSADSLSGLGKFFDKKYRLKRNSIVTGDFEFGDSFQIS